VVAVSDAVADPEERPATSAGEPLEAAEESGDEITRRPVQLSSGLSVAAAVLVLATAAAGGGSAVAVAALGVPLLGGALLFGRPGAIDLAGFLLLVAVCVAAIGGAPMPLVLLGTLGAVLAWDLANNAFSLGYQLGREAPTRRVEVMHAASSTGVGVFVAGVGVVLYRAGVEGLPSTAVLVMLVAALLLVAALRD
jgi:hypothetical protein